MWVNFKPTSWFYATHNGPSTVCTFSPPTELNKQTKWFFFFLGSKSFVYMTKLGAPLSKGKCNNHSSFSWIGVWNFDDFSKRAKKRSSIEAFKFQATRFENESLICGNIKHASSMHCIAVLIVAHQYAAFYIDWESNFPLACHPISPSSTCKVALVQQQKTITNSNDFASDWTICATRVIS